ncbi:hypothetical protein [Parenemella sanctibonifatiensis]|uniref:DivIVA domain-containing protein n=1 Tax=Parenemella sanctibonifatiensis TaxID=2016505 RepID=A0A255E4K6_9ACTN|nr:hypothetical protein [Parenemella sanctibonifatiensis]OYN86479.1 hypothetical protein CGZ92_09010 [Parenemella sanctibonifatiensis]
MADDELRELVRFKTFSTADTGYGAMEVRRLLDELRRAANNGDDLAPILAKAELSEARFGYDKAEVDAFLARVRAIATGEPVEDVATEPPPTTTPTAATSVRITGTSLLSDQDRASGITEGTGTKPIAESVKEFTPDLTAAGSALDTPTEPEVDDEGEWAEDSDDDEPEDDDAPDAEPAPAKRVPTTRTPTTRTPTTRSTTAWSAPAGDPVRTHDPQQEALRTTLRMTLHRSSFAPAAKGSPGYDKAEVDTFLRKLRSRLDETVDLASTIASAQFTMRRQDAYSVDEIDDFLDHVSLVSQGRPSAPPRPRPASQRQSTRKLGQLLAIVVVIAIVVVAWLASL